MNESDALFLPASCRTYCKQILNVLKLWHNVGMTHQQIGLLIILVGLLLLIGGLLVWAGAFFWFGHLPGDFRIQTETVHIDIPFTSMILLSLLLSLFLGLITRLFEG